MDLIKESGGKINEIAISDEIKNSKPRRNRYKRLTRKICRELLDYAKKHPSTPQNVIAERFGLSSGSVSRVLSGKAAIMNSH